MMRKIAIITGFLMFAQPTFSTTYTQQETFSGQPIFAITKTFEQFNPSWGTLDSIRITLNLDITGGQLRVDNDGLEVSAGNAYFGAEGTLSSSDVLLKNTSDNNVWDGLITCTSTFFNLAADDGDGSTTDSNAPDGAVYNPGSESNNVDDFINSTYFNDYIGTGAYDIILNVYPYVDVSALCGIVYYESDSVTTSGSVIIDYDYTIPEPATLVLLSLGSILLRKRRK